MGDRQRQPAAFLGCRDPGAIHASSSSGMVLSFCLSLLTSDDGSTHPWVTADNVLSPQESQSRCDNLRARNMNSPGLLSTVTQLFPTEDALPASSKPVTGRPKRQSETLSRTCPDPSPHCPTGALLAPSQAAATAANARRGVSSCIG